MKRIIDWLMHWSKDKILHFMCTLLTAMIAGCVAKICGGDKWSIIAAAWFASFIAGMGKEICDELRNGGSDEKDWAADVCGMLTGCLLLIILTF